MMSHVSLFLSAMSLFFFVEFLIIYTIRIFFPLHFEKKIYENVIFKKSTGGTYFHRFDRTGFKPDRKKNRLNKLA